ncbi:trifunctional transcriptional activator/DNA repair protein Ada/methylated-DNA--[protein]-cysteine S-methyltransferase [Paracoccus sp. 1_MG-2023]|nr:trifunctional transcriptional activator/DNA repair protein Ada/methylated-DNA--[protein]-cysteine S-methyltransferase [Paracoccus sp. 1_MG-2023]MBU2957095.1 trifunctional transcriptional activator/DNA repair protein Ada/methylated-DNA--[protein]-cysteine S-methyltransferase [Paracoccus sp. C2R09]MDO6669571.1 trifunctional transcriptional activator/DNA repair protein Ada/methylated-DNA--[protein]-cysteine S-methyltransferase [Paracoccus sp. 1_MG-2023]
MRDATDDTLYQALLARDPAYEGRALVGVTSTGIFCRLTCPARKPLARNCRWFADAAAARAAGFRPCLRCRPEDRPLPALVEGLLAQLQAQPDRRWTEADLAAMGHDPSTVRRQFRTHMGRSFLQMAREVRMRQGLERIAIGDDVIEAQLEAGFDSASGFRAAFRRLFGHAPQDLRQGGDLSAEWLDTPLGGMIAIVDDRSLHLLEFVDRKALPAGLQRLSRMVGGRIGLGRRPVTDRVEAALQDFFAGRDGRLDLPVTLHGTEFQRRVWTALRQVPPGETRSYGGLAADIGSPRAVRAVAAANAGNRLALVVPCHRVIGSDGKLTGYAGGLWRKERLIALEASYRDPGANRVDAGQLPL